MNPRCGFPHYSLSRGAPSATWVLLQANRHISIWKINGGESGIRTHGSFESPVFKTGSLNHSDISPQTEYRPRAKREIYYTIIATVCQSFWRKNRSRRPPAGKTVKLKFLGTGMISVMPVPLLAAHPRECSPQGRTRYVPSACACRWTCPVLPHRPP